MVERHKPPRLSKAKLTPNISKLVERAKALYQDKLAYFAQNHKPPAYIVAAPGRVNCTSVILVCFIDDSLRVVFNSNLSFVSFLHLQ